MAYIPHADAGYMHSDAERVDRVLRDGDGLGWPGDPRLELRMGVMEVAEGRISRTLGRWVNKGEILGRRYEVWRRCEDGVERRVGSWTLEEFDRIILDLSGMRLDSPGHVDTQAKIDTTNAEIEAAAMRDYRDAQGEILEHGAKLLHDTTQPKNVFRGMPGRRDEPKAEPTP